MGCDSRVQPMWVIPSILSLRRWWWCMADISYL
jgi:hypothetical protein